MQGAKSRSRRRFSPQFKAEVVELCRQGERSVGKVAADLDLTETAVRRWVAQAGEQEDAPVSRGLSPEEELVQLRKENRLLREERDVLKRAVSFFARETR